MTVCPTCPLPIGSGECHCASCGAHFGSAAGFDRHRRDGRCVDPAATPRATVRHPAGKARSAPPSAPTSPEPAPVVVQATPAPAAAPRQADTAATPRATVRDAVRADKALRLVALADRAPLAAELVAMAMRPRYHPRTRRALGALADQLLTGQPGFPHPPRCGRDHDRVPDGDPADPPPGVSDVDGHVTR